MGSNYINRGEAIEIQFPAASPDVKPAEFSVGEPISIGDMPAVAMTPRDANSTSVTALSLIHI